MRGFRPASKRRIRPGGHSMGGVACRRLAAFRPRRAIALLASVLFPEENPPRELRGCSGLFSCSPSRLLADGKTKRGRPSGLAHSVLHISLPRAGFEMKSISKPPHARDDYSHILLSFGMKRAFETKNVDVTIAPRIGASVRDGRIADSVVSKPTKS